MREHVDHRDIASFADDHVNLKRDDAKDLREQVWRLRDKLEAYVKDQPDFELRKMLLSGSLAKGHFSFTPLTPRLAFVSSPMLKSGDFYFKTTDLALIFSLNQLTRAMAKNSIIANGPRPYGDLTEAVMAAESSNSVREQVDGLLIYTDESRYWIDSTDVVHGSGSHPLIGRLSFTTQDQAVLQQIAEDGRIHEVTVYCGGRAVSHLKHARLVQLAGSFAKFR